jgi:NADH:ubiquinone oxidoreductase subunit E
MRNCVKVALYVAFYHPLVRVPVMARESVTNVCDGVMCASVWPESIGSLMKIRFPYWFQDHAKGFLYNPV